VQWVRGYGARRYGVQGGGSESGAAQAALNATMDNVLRAHYSKAACLDIGCGHGKGLPSLMQRAPRPFTGAAPCRTAGVTACNLYNAHAGLVTLEAMLALRPYVQPSGASGYSYDLVDLAHQAVQWVFADAVRLFIVDAVLRNQSGTYFTYLLSIYLRVSIKLILYLLVRVLHTLDLTILTRLARLLS
jgi:hypothetical protein